MRKAGRKLCTLFFALITISGILITAYPFAAKLYNRTKALRVIDQYDKDVQNQTLESVQKQLDLAGQLNSYLAENGFRWEWQNEKSQAYLEAMPLEGDVCGSIEIPALHVRLPIYKGTDSSYLSLGAGHLPGTSLPIGGPSTHAVITGHTGLPTARLFSDLDQLKPGDRILIHILSQTLTYEVTGKEVVLPEQTQGMNIVENEDLLTLVTCTPYGINSHRLLVHARRIPYEQTLETELPSAVLPYWKQVWAAAGLGLLAVLISLALLYRRFAAQRRNKTNE